MDCPPPIDPPAVVLPAPGATPVVVAPPATDPLLEVDLGVGLGGGEDCPGAAG